MSKVKKKSLIGWTDGHWLKKFKYHRWKGDIKCPSGLINTPSVFSNRKLFSKELDEYPAKVRITIEEIK